MSIPPDRPPRMPYIKMCGFTTPQEARLAAQLGADLIGLNFFSGSLRAVSFGMANRIQEIVHKTGQERGGKRPVRTVAVMVNPEPEMVLEILREVNPDILQFHGDEPPHVCRYFRRPFIKAFRPRGAGDIAKIATYAGGYCIGYMLDGAGDEDYGGTGKQVTAQLANDIFRAQPRGFLAGGLTPANVGPLVAQMQPYGVDVASGIETRPGSKSPELMASFVRAVRDAVIGGQG